MINDEIELLPCSFCWEQPYITTLEYNSGTPYYIITCGDSFNHGWSKEELVEELNSKYMKEIKLKTGKCYKTGSTLTDSTSFMKVTNNTDKDNKYEIDYLSYHHDIGVECMILDYNSDITEISKEDFDRVFDSIQKMDQVCK